MLHSTTFKTPVGELFLIAKADIVLAAGFKSIQALLERMSPDDLKGDVKHVGKISIISDLVKDYFDGDLNALNGIKVSQAGAKFSQDAWKAMRKIPAGKVLSYAQLAKRAGSADAIRAAGTACGNNLIAPIVPCHRVIKTSGAIGNYGYGVKIKEWLLSHEGAL
jgi:methylated-DNA-[protein]-cysteine S-methyltransferase